MLKAIYPLAILAAALLPSSARGSEMFFSRDDVGQMWLQIVGRIDDGDDVKFRNMLLEAIDRGEQIAKVSIYSPLGRLDAALKIGRLIRTMHLSTVAPQLVPLLGRRTCDIHAMNGRTTVLQYEPLRQRGDPRCICAGECFLIWAAGSVRHGDAVQIRPVAHISDDTRPETPTTDMWSIDQPIIAKYLREMEIPDATIDRVFNSAPDKMDYLSKNERDTLANGVASPSIKVLFEARCRRHAPTSPAALACEQAILRELYWAGASRLLDD
jgi:hypothetical protein